MTETSSYPGYATPTFSLYGSYWAVFAEPWTERIGRVEVAGPQMWTATDNRNRYVGLFPDKQAAGEALVKHAGYEVLR